MRNTTVEPQPASPARSEAVALLLERLAWLMDRAVKVPGTKVTFGLDALLGILPVGGDVLTGIVQAGLVLVALKHYRVPKAVAAQMMGNVLVDIAVGSIPVLGDIFDVGFKANTRNMKLLEPYRRPPEMIVESRPERFLGTAAPVVDFSATPRGTSWHFIVPIGIILFAALGLMLVGFVAVVQWLLKH